MIMLSLLIPPLGTLRGDLWLSIFLYLSIFIFAWAKGKLGNPAVAVLYTILIMFLLFYQHDTLIWVVLAFYVYSTYGKEIFGK